MHFTWFDFLPHSIEVGNYRILLHAAHVWGALIVVSLLTVLSLIVWLSFRRPGEQLVPEPRLTVRNLFEIMIEKLEEMFVSIIGPQGREFFPLLASLFIFIFFSNLLGVIPGMPAATSTVRTNAACAIIVFLYYNYQGFRAHGIGYLKHFFGPVWWLGWLMFPIELVGHLVRPFSLSLRLAGNITGDHTVMGIFSSLVPYFIPIPFIALGIFVAFIQAFVFTLLATSYIALAVSHEH